MCEPASAAYIGFAALSTFASYSAQKSQAKATNNYQRQVREKNIEASMEAFRHNVNQEQTRMVQEETSANQEMHKSSLRAREAAGQALASSTSAGVNLESLMGDFLRQEGDYNASIQQQKDWKKQQSAENMKGYTAQANNRIASYNPAPVQGPSLAGAIAGLGMETASAYGKKG